MRTFEMPRGRIVLACACLAALSFLVPQTASAQEKPEQVLLKEVAPIYEKSGEEGVRAWMKANKGRVKPAAITEMAKQAVRERAKGRLDLALVLAEVKGDPKCQADVFSQMGRYSYYVSDDVQALACYEKALSLYLGLGDLSGQADIYVGQGDMLRFSGELEKAMAMFEKALPLYEKAQDARGQGNVYMVEGNVFRRKGQNEKALEMYEKALPFFEKAQSLMGLGNAYMGEGDVFLRTGENEKALAMYEKALPYFEKIQDAAGQGTVRLNEGDLYRYTGEYEKALEMYDKALPLFETAKSAVGQGNVYKSKANLFRYIGEFDKALEMFDKALPLYDKANDPLGQGNVYFGEGDIFLYTGENAKALAMYEKALPFFVKAQDPLGQGNVHRSMGDVFIRTGENAKALALYEKALEFYEKAQSPLGKANTYLFEGNVFLYLGEYEKALAMYEKALTYYEKIQSPLGKGNVCKGKADVYRDMGEHEKALAMYEEALPLYEKVQDFLGQGNVFRGEAEVLRNTGESERALAMYEKALPLYEKVQDPRSQGEVHRGEGDIFLERGENEKALARYEKALSLYTKASDPEGQGFATIEKGRTLARMGKGAEAAPLFDEGLTLLERVRYQAGFSEMKKSYLEKVNGKYEEAALFMIESGRPDKAFRIAESMKARAFLDRLAEGTVDLEKGVSPDLKEKRDRLVGKLNSQAQGVSGAAASGDEKALAEAREQYSKTEAELDQVQMEIRLKNPLYASVRYPQPAALDEIQKKVLNPGETLVAYFLAKDSLYAFLVTKGSFDAVKLPAATDAMHEAIRSYLQWESLPPPSKGADVGAGAVARGGKLYDAVFRPLEPKIQKGATLVIVPDGELCKVPFEALVASAKGKKPVYLLEKHAIKYVQSASVLAFLRTQYKQEGTTDQFIGFGDPVYDYEHFRKGEPETGEAEIARGDVVAGLTRDRYATGGGTLARLPASGEEVQQIAGLFEGGAAKPSVDLRLDAREENAKSEDMKSYGYVHFSCHGLLGDNFQSLALSQIPESEEDGYLTLGEIMNSDWNARLVVLSACQTGRGKIEKGEGVTGLTRAVMYAGSPAAVVSLWSVSDVGTKDLMVRFYRNLIEKRLPKDEALRRAKLEMLKSGAFSSPFFWSPFVMYGE